MMLALEGLVMKLYSQAEILNVQTSLVQSFQCNLGYWLRWNNELLLRMFQWQARLTPVFGRWYELHLFVAYWCVMGLMDFFLALPPFQVICHKNSIVTFHPHSVVLAALMTWSQPLSVASCLQLVVLATNSFLAISISYCPQTANGSLKICKCKSLLEEHFWSLFIFKYSYRSLEILQNNFLWHLRSQNICAFIERKDRK